ncbi:hypothetical protein QAD02_013086 [Eretmocerus hayati]|uniref:Uncharacterized protein n=1 Tax=Eretmocerus hayati TaxID=131215 RepID=A0ACC2P437_9HYME|nr:hypothetical protein QAD02_013086 [Eretmocerus hayati]
MHSGAPDFHGSVRVRVASNLTKTPTQLDSANRRDAKTSRGSAAGAPTPDEFREPVLIIAPPCLPASERCDLEDAAASELGPEVRMARIPGSAGRSSQSTAPRPTCPIPPTL